jgi:hypothetical protein
VGPMLVAPITESTLIMDRVRVPIAIGDMAKLVSFKFAPDGRNARRSFMVGSGPMFGRGLTDLALKIKTTIAIESRCAPLPPIADTRR